MPAFPARTAAPLALAGALLLGATACGSGPARRPQWYYTCGDPVCRGYEARPGSTRCTSESPGGTCAVEGQACDPVDDCNRLLLCAARDPTLAGCPISRRDAKRDVRYLTPEDLEALARQLRALRLASYRYRDAGPSSPLRLGFVIDDGPPPACLDAAGERVDLYGYASLAVATLQAQARQIEALERELATLRGRVESLAAPGSTSRR